MVLESQSRRERIQIGIKDFEPARVQGLKSLDAFDHVERCSLSRPRFG